ncbi:MAG: bifunctional nuclease family protein [Planctomycetia bacterium]|nr:bifunctional nuclease family protein [Planctomycetia bacterium]
MKCQRCQEQATLHITDVLLRPAAYEERHLCSECAQKYLFEMDFQQVTDHRLRGPHNEHGEYQLEVARIIISELDDHQVVVFREVGGKRSFPLVIGIYEATAIDRQLKHLPSPRPLTHNAWLATVKALGATFQAVGINSVQNETYFASLRLIQPDGQPVRVDIRPSDGTIMALLASVPIFISADLFARVSE